MPRYHVFGADRGTGRDEYFTIKCKTETAARVAAQSRGVLVSRIEREHGASNDIAAGILKAMFVMAAVVTLAGLVLGALFMLPTIDSGGGMYGNNTPLNAVSVSDRRSVADAIRDSGVPLPIAEPSARLNALTVSYDEFEDRTSTELDISLDPRGDHTVWVFNSYAGTTPTDANTSFLMTLRCSRSRADPWLYLYWIVDGVRFEMPAYGDNMVSAEYVTTTAVVHTFTARVPADFVEWVARADSVRLKFVEHEHELSQPTKDALLQMVRQSRPSP